MIAALTLAMAVAASPAGPDTAFVTYEAGVPVCADWIQRRGREVRSWTAPTQSSYRDVRVTVRADETVDSTRTAVWNAGQAEPAPSRRALGAGAIYWSDQVASSIEQAVRRARVLEQPLVHLPGASLYRDARADVVVERLDATDWVVTANGKRWDVVTDSSGAMLASTMPTDGVVIERRTGFTTADWPAWPADAPPPDGAYRALDVRIPAPEGHVLAGTLTLPKGAGPFAAAVLITGLSPNNRDNGDPPWMPLKDLADALTRRGIAVLRVDDRGMGASTGDHAPSTTFDEANDVRTELRWLRARRDIAATRTALVGYSEGGLIAPMVAADDRALAGIVTLAGPGVPGMEVARYQIGAAVERDTSIAPADREAAITKALADSLTPRESTYLAMADPLTYARRVRCPALLLHGGSDLTVPPRSAERLASAMRAGGNRDVTVRIFAGLSHAFLPDPVGLSSAWAGLPAFLTSPDVLRTLGDWAAAHLAAPPRHLAARARP